MHGEIILTQSVSISLLVAAIVAIAAAALAWVMLGSYARTETVRGILVTERPSAKVAAPASGVVAELAVREGSVVRRGDRLAVINLDRHAASGGAVLADGIASIGARQSLAREQITLNARRGAADRERLTTAMATASQQARDIEGQIQLQEDVVRSNQSMFDQIAKVVERGFVSKVEMERRRQNLIASQQSLAGLRQQLTQKRADANAARAQLAGLSADAARGESEIRASLQSLSQQRMQMEGERAYVITAPISGRVTAIQAGVGKLAPTQAPLLTIVPADTSLKAELFAPTRAIGFVRSGQETRILYDAFPYQRFGSFPGKIQAISRIVIDPREVDLPVKLEEPVYRVTVSLDRQAIDAYGEKIGLQPGMALEATIILERQGFLDWLLKPLHAISRRTA
ncbi:HlyD family secretion protein [Sphingomonas sp. 67-41]|uniref:HlyD family secretion protein n=1 Tax=Sphingomonas TaxID=13687 RepID=UPI000960FBC0|nr:HlyD family efflux transporter periplasmic adaptor subunit [Sphingomonas sp. 67-41]OJY47465.1 MAG: hypothetical protein BGP17_09725 [Sphingomonas sp. 67-41]